MFECVTSSTFIALIEVISSDFTKTDLWTIFQNTKIKQITKNVINIQMKKNRQTDMGKYFNPIPGSLWNQKYFLVIFWLYFRVFIVIFGLIMTLESNWNIPAYLLAHSF